MSPDTFGIWGKVAEEVKHLACYIHCSSWHQPPRQSSMARQLETCHTQSQFQSLWGSSYLRHSLQKMLIQVFWPTQEEKILSLNCFQWWCRALSDEEGIIFFRRLSPHSGMQITSSAIKGECASQPGKMLGFASSPWLLLYPLPGQVPSKLGHLLGNVPMELYASHQKHAF